MDRSNVETPNRRAAGGGHPPAVRVAFHPRRKSTLLGAMFKELGDPQRLRLLVRLAEGKACASELAESEGEKITTVSARLKTLYLVRLVKRRREAKHVYVYARQRARVAVGAQRD